MSREYCSNLIRLSAEYYLNSNSKIGLREGFIEISKDKFIAVGFEKTKVAKDWEDTDYFNIIILTKANEQQYYFTKIEHPVDIFAPKYVNDDMKINWVEETIQVTNNELMNDLYCLIDSLSEYTLTIHDKPYSIYEKYLSHSISVSYEIWEHYDKSKIEVSPFLMVRCQLYKKHFANATLDCLLPQESDHLLIKKIEYPINIYSLFQTSVFQYRPFKIWHGNVTVDGIKVTLESK